MRKSDFWQGLVGVGFFLSISVYADDIQWMQRNDPPQYRVDANGQTYWDGYVRTKMVRVRVLQDPPQWRSDQWGRTYWDGYFRTRVEEVGENDAPEEGGNPTPPSNSIRRLPKTKSFGNGVIGELVEEEGEEEKVHRHTGSNRGHYRLYKWIPGHTDPDTKEWISRHKEEVGEEDVGQDLDQESGQHKAWSWRKE